MESQPVVQQRPCIKIQPNTELINRNLIKKGVLPTPKIVHTLRKKQIQKYRRKNAKTSPSPPPNEEDEELTHFRDIKSEYRNFMEALAPKKTIGKPWECLRRGELREFVSVNGEYDGHYQHLKELSHVLEKERDRLMWLLDRDIELEDGLLENWTPPKRTEAQAIRFLVTRLSGAEMNVKDWKLTKLMRHSGLQFTEGQMLRLVEDLGKKGQWRNALSVVEWVYSAKEQRLCKSRFVYTKVLAVLGKARRPEEALQIFNFMRGDCHIYPDMAAYHSIAVTLGQAGLLKELVNVIDYMKEKPSRKLKNFLNNNWDPVLQPDLVVFNAVLNACVPSRQWKGVSWVFEQLRKSGLKPNGATHGLAMEVMMQSGKYDLVHEYFRKMRRSGVAPKALTYKILVKAFWEEGKVDEAIQAVRNMENIGVVGTASVYYELACCLCYNGRWKQAMEEIEKLKKLPLSKPLGVAFTGMIFSCMDGGHIDDCFLLFEQSKKHCVPDIGTINAMLKVYGRKDMFSEAKELFEDTIRGNFGSNGSYLKPDAYTYSSILEASASAAQWEYFDYVYKEMVLSGCQFDQSKHASLLVKASRAGKWHLLEHAFDATLEAGEMPHPSFFTELVCQAITRHDFERVVTILNCLAYAPFQVSEKQWRDLFDDYGDGISKSDLEQLFHTILNNDVAMEASVSNLSTVLQSLCGSSGRRNDRESLSDGCDRGSKNRSGFQVSYEDISNISLANHISDDGEDYSGTESFANFEYDDSDGHEKARQSGNLGDTNNTYASIEQEIIDFDNLDDDIEFDYGTLKNEELANSGRTKLPSADTILKYWKESAKDDKKFIPFQLEVE